MLRYSIPKLLLGILLLVAGASAQTTAVITDRALGVNPFAPGSNGTPAPVFLSYAQVRVCTMPASGSPCTPVASITDIFGNALSISGGNFGQTTTDVVGRFYFGCLPGNYEIQVATTGSNTPAATYFETCPSNVNLLANNNTWAGTNTFGVITTWSLNGDQLIDGVHYTCTATGILAAQTALGGSGGLIDATACTGGISVSSSITLSSNNVTLFLGNTTWSCTIAVTTCFNVTGNNVLIQGSGTSSIITGAFLGTQPSTYGILVQLNGTNDELRHVQLQSQASDSTTAQIGIEMVGTGSIVDYNTLSGTSGSTGFNYGIVVAQTSNAFIENNQIFGIKGSGAGAGAGILTTGASSNLFIRGNYISDSNVDSPGVHNIYISQQNTTGEISDNILVGGPSSMIKMFATDAQGTGITQFNIHNNQLLLGGNVSNASGAIELNNNVTQNIVANNYIAGYVNGPGIEPTDGGVNAKIPSNNIIVGNYITNVGTYCIQNAGASNTLITSNYCNTPSVLSAGTYDAIIVGSGNVVSNGVQVVNNYVTGGNFHAALNVSSAAPVPTNTFYSGNSFAAGGSGTILENGTNSIAGLNLLGTQLNLGRFAASDTNGVVIGPGSGYGLLLNSTGANYEAIYSDTTNNRLDIGFTGTVSKPAAPAFQFGANSFYVNQSLLISNSAPTISTHFNTSGDSISNNNGTAAFTVTVGTGAAGSTGAVGLPTAAHGWVCTAQNQNRGAYIQQTASTTTTATFTNYGTTVGTPVNWTNSDVLAISCHAY